MAHPDGIALAFFPYPFEQRAFAQNLDFRAAEFAFMPGLDLAAQLRRHGLLAIADSENWHAGGEERVWHARGVLIMTEAGPPDRMTAFGASSANAFSALWKGAISQ